MALKTYIYVILVATIKTLLTPPVAYGLGMNYYQCFISVFIGGIIGFAVFFTIYNGIMSLTRKKKGKSAKNIRKARKIVQLKHKYKLGVFIMILPILSVPVMAYIIRKFYGRDKKILLYSAVVLLVWSLATSLVYLPMRQVVG